MDQDGLLGVDEIIAALRTKLPPGEIRAAVDLAMQEAGHGPASAGLEFEDFMRMLKVRYNQVLGSVPLVDVIRDGDGGLLPDEGSDVGTCMSSFPPAWQQGFESHLPGGGSTPVGPSWDGNMRLSILAS